MTVNVITPPDILHTQVESFLLVQPSVNIRQQFQNLIKDFERPMNVYLYDPKDVDEHDYEWLLNVCRLADYTIIDVDNLDTVVKNLASYMISLPKTFWLTNDEVTPYNKLSINRIYNLDWLYEKLKEE